MQNDALMHREGLKGYYWIRLPRAWHKTTAKCWDVVDDGVPALCRRMPSSGPSDPILISSFAAESELDTRGLDIYCREAPQPVGSKCQERPHIKRSPRYWPSCWTVPTFRLQQWRQRPVCACVRSRSLTQHWSTVWRPAARTPASISSRYTNGLLRLNLHTELQEMLFLIPPFMQKPFVPHWRKKVNYVHPAYYLNNNPYDKYHIFYYII